MPVTTNASKPNAAMRWTLMLVGVIVAKREGILDESAYYGEGELVAA